MQHGLGQLKKEVFDDYIAYLFCDDDRSGYLEALEAVGLPEWLFTEGYVRNFKNQWLQGVYLHRTTRPDAFMLNSLDFEHSYTPDLGKRMIDHFVTESAKWVYGGIYATFPVQAKLWEMFYAFYSRFASLYQAEYAEGDMDLLPKHATEYALNKMHEQFQSWEVLLFEHFKGWYIPTPSDLHKAVQSLADLPNDELAGMGLTAYDGVIYFDVDGDMFYPYEDEE